MKMMKRTIALVLALVMVFSALPAVFAANGSITVAVGNASLKKGESVTVPVTVKIATDVDVFAVAAKVIYDEENLVLTDINAENGDDRGVCASSSWDTGVFDGEPTFSALFGRKGLTNGTEGTLFWLTFETTDEVANGTYAINIEANEEADIFLDNESVALGCTTVTPGTITVSGGVDKLTDSNTTLEGLKASYTYTGSAIEPAFTVKYNGKTLKKGTDYTVAYENNTNVGTATVTVTGTGSYKGSTTATFEITKMAGTITGTKAYTKTYGAASFKLDAKANSGAALTYKSDNTAVATVDASGNVTVVGSGAAVITVSAAETENYTKPADFQVTVTVEKANQTLTGTASYTKTYGDAAFNLNIGGAQGTVSYTSSKPTVATVDNKGNVTIVGVGETTITASAAEVTGKYNAATKAVKVTVNQKTVTVSGITAANKVYDKSAAATVDVSKATINGKVGSDDLKVTATGAFTDANAGENKTVNLTVSLTGAKAANYKLASNSQKTATATIEKATVAVPTAKTGLVYNTKAQTGVAETNDYTVTGGTETNAGSYTATATLKDAKNYKWADASFNGNVSWSIAKAKAADLTEEKGIRYSTTAVQTLSVSDIAKKLNAPGEVKIESCTFNDSDKILGSSAFTADAVTYALKSGLTEDNTDDTATAVIVVSSENYENVTLTLTIKVIDKIDVSEDVVFADGNAIYNGKVQKHETATYKGSADGITYSYSADPVNVGTYKVTAIYEDADNYGEKTVDFRIDAATLTVSGGKVETKEYDGNTDATLESVAFSGLVNGEKLTEDDYTVTAAAYDNANAGTGKKVSFTVELNDTETASNYALSGSAPVITGAIDPKEITVSVEDIAAQEFTGNAITPAVVISAEGTLDGYVLVAGKDYTVSYDDNTDVGTASATVEAKSGSNYTFDDAEATFEITEAVAPEIADLADEYTYNYTGNESLEIVGIPANAGDVTYEIGTLTGATEMVSNVSAANGKVSFTVEAVDISYVGKTVTIPVTIKMQNYADVTINVVISRTEKDQPVLAVQNIEKVYDGNELTADDIVGVATFEGEVLTGTWVWVTEPATLVNANEAGYTATVKFIPDNSEDFMETEADITVVIRKATPTGQPEFTRIRSSKKTLADAELGVGTIKPEGTIAWVDSLDTVVERRAKYEWIFTPNDTTNYNTLSGEIMLYSGSSSSKSDRDDDDRYEEEEEEEREESVIDRYDDVSARDWYADAVEMVVTKGLFEGVSKDRFDPNGTMTRAMLVTVLWRLEGEPEADNASDFTDVSPYAWYADAVAWANENGIVTGISADSFAPDVNVTREQMAVILFRYADSIGVDCSARADLAEYADAANVAAYAQDAMSWAVAEGLISGMTATTLAPNGTATRAQVATILMRFVENVL